MTSYQRHAQTTVSCYNSHVIDKFKIQLFCLNIRSFESRFERRFICTHQEYIYGCLRTHVVVKLTVKVNAMWCCRRCLLRQRVGWLGLLGLHPSRHSSLHFVSILQVRIRPTTSVFNAQLVHECTLVFSHRVVSECCY